MSTPAWMKVDKAKKTVSLDIHAGQTADNNHWNFNGYDKGNATITVPEGYKVTIKFTNDDPSLAHSIGVDSAYATFPPTFTNPQRSLRARSAPIPPTRARRRSRTNRKR